MTDSAQWADSVKIVEKNNCLQEEDTSKGIWDTAAAFKSVEEDIARSRHKLKLRHVGKKK